MLFQYSYCDSHLNDEFKNERINFIFRSLTLEKAHSDSLTISRLSLKKPWLMRQRDLYLHLLCLNKKKIMNIIKNLSLLLKNKSGYTIKQTYVQDRNNEKRKLFKNKSRIVHINSK